MSDSDDWEKNAEKDDAALDDILKTKKFGDEQTAPVEEVKVVVQPVPKQKIGTKTPIFDLFNVIDQFQQIKTLQNFLNIIPV